MPTEPDNSHRTTVEPTDVADHRASRAIAEDIFCPQCTYNLRGLTGDRCPECGIDITEIREGESQIPWVRRKKIGRIRAYWKTVWVVLFHTSQIGREVSRSVDDRAARRFRQTTVILAYLPIALLTVVWMLTAPNSYQFVLDVGGYGFLAAIHVGVASCIAAISAMPHYALRHRDLPLTTQHRAAVLSEYACAPLAGMLLPAIWCGLGPPSTAIGYYLIAGSFLAAFLFALLINLHRIVRYTVKDARPVWWITLKVAALWMIVGILTLVGIPLAYLFLAVVFFSLF